MSNTSLMGVKNCIQSILYKNFEPCKNSQHRLEKCSKTGEILSAEALHQKEGCHIRFTF